MINPALHAFPEEAALIGSMVVGYGELDITMVSCAGNAMEMTLPLLDALDQVNSEFTRIEIIRRLASPAFDRLGILPQFTNALAAQTSVGRYATPLRTAIPGTPHPSSSKRTSSATRKRCGNSACRSGSRVCRIPSADLAQERSGGSANTSSAAGLAGKPSIPG